MMSPIKLTDIIPKINKYFPFENYLLHLKYQNKKELNVNKLKGYIKKNEDGTIYDIIFVSMTNTYKYYSFKHKDFGNPINFVKNRIASEDAITNQNSLIIACRQMLIFMSEEGYSENELIGDNKSTEEEDFNYFIERPFSSYYNLEIIKDYSYFEVLGIDKDIVNHKLFENVIFNSKGLTIKNKKDNTKHSLKNITNTCFVMYDNKGNECGINYSNFLFSDEKNTNQELNIYASFSNKEKGLWFSNKINIRGRKKRNIILVNHPAEAVAHFYIHQELLSYVSYFEKLTIENIKSIKEYVTLNNMELTLATPNKKEFLVDDIKLYLAFLQKDYISFDEQESQRIYLTIQTNHTDQNKLAKLLRGIERVNRMFVMNSIEILGKSSKQHLKDDLIKVNHKLEEEITISLPYTYNHLNNFIKILFKAYPNHYVKEINKTEHIYWRKASQINHKTIHKSDILNQILKLD